MRNLLLTGLFLSALTGLSASFAQTSPACSSEAFSAFDFWIGDWDVHTPDGQLAGTNEIVKSADGCRLIETWTGAGGSTGQSLNYFNPVTGTWRQIWVSPGTVIDYEGGLTKNGTILLTGTLTYTSTAKLHEFSGEWTLLDDGRVKQDFEIRDPDTGDWSNWFTGLYTRKTD